jgi:hypothetical protein
MMFSLQAVVVDDPSGALVIATNEHGLNRAVGVDRSSDESVVKIAENYFVHDVPL